ncbi:hypothetical protein CC78DRAFT_267984 [Lojkania enalia]|uniref:MOZ protein represents a chromatin-associated acetyltransferase n=1 Tax=Lojkania enalia TaxID=147567 RepID=A0A9P4K9E5_9PLEO|nr:hypothetical protein CC78DRAFT_267984 [Didymosphaeria enalia]
MSNMSAPRLPFLWPMLYKPLNAPRAACRIRLQKVRIARNYNTTPRLADAPTIQRYGTAQEPAPYLREQKQAQEAQEQQNSSTKKATPESVEEEEEEERTPKPPTLNPIPLDAADSVPPSPMPDPIQAPNSKPLDTVLHMPSPDEEEQCKPPHLKTPPYVHHFDTYGLVKDLAKSGFTQDQAITIMKAVRRILTVNMELARDGLVSKSSVENETYLFRAACSELRTEITHSRKGEIEKMRTERNQLQHEVDILNQRLSQETGNLKDELKGLFDDRKMAVRQEQRTQEAKIQELNYKITVALNSDARSEVEGLRWVLTRRAAITVGVSALMLFAALRYSSYVAHTQQQEKKITTEKKTPPDKPNRPDPPNLTVVGKDESIGGELLATEGGVSLG